MTALWRGLSRGDGQLGAKKQKVDLLLDIVQAAIEIGFPWFVLPVYAEER